MGYVINRLYELSTYRKGEKLGAFMFSTTHTSHPIDVRAFCERFLLGVDSDLAELCELAPAVLLDGEIVESFEATLICTWPPLR